VGSRGGGRASERGGRPAAVSASEISKVLPLVKRALKVLSEREVAPQLGLMKSTLLQLDSTFSEREYGASSFRDFMEKVAQTGAVVLKNAGRSMMVESREEGAEAENGSSQPEPMRAEREAAPPPARRGGHTPRGAAQRVETVERYLSDPPASDEDDEDSMPVSPMTMQDGIRAVQQVFTQASPAPRWPMYVRQAKQFLKTGIEGFDERKYGFASAVDLLRAAGKEGVLRLERDRHGAVRVFPGAKLTGMPAAVAGDAPVEVEVEEVTQGMASAEPVEEQPIMDAETVEPTAVIDADATPARKGARKRKAAAPRAKTAKGEKGEKGETSEKAAKPRARKATRAKSEAADQN
jgi:hypothetical protein